MKAKIYILCLLLVALSASFSEQFSKTIYNNIHGYSITLPDNWVQISKDSTTGEKEFQNILMFEFNNLYKPAASKSNSEYPYILIKVIKDETINGVKSLNPGTTQVDSITADNFWLGDKGKVFVKTTNQLWMNEKLATKDGVNLASTTILIAGYKFIYNIHVYMAADKVKEILPEIITIVSSIKVDERNLHPYSSNKIQTSVVSVLMLCGLITALALFILFRYPVAFGLIKKALGLRKSIHTVDIIIQLFRKDIILYKLILPLISMIILLYIFLLPQNSFQYVFKLAVTFCTLIPFVYLTKETTSKGYSLLNSLPLSKHHIFAGYYLSAWIFFVLFAAFYILIALILFPVLKGEIEYGYLNEYLSLIISRLIILTINIAVFFPVIIIYGSGRALIFSIIFANIAVSKIFSPGGLGFFSYTIFTISEKVKYFTRSYQFFMTNNFGVIVYFLSFVLLLFLINYFSYRITLFLFTKREFKLA